MVNTSSDPNYGISTSIDAVGSDYNKVDTTMQTQNSTFPSTTTSTTTTQNIVDPLLTNKTEPEDLDLKWRRLKCRKCNMVIESRLMILKCPKCGNQDREMFDDAD